MIVQKLLKIGIPFSIMLDQSEGDSKNLRGYFIIICEKDKKQVEKINFYKSPYKDGICEYNLCKSEIEEFLKIKNKFKKIILDGGTVYEPKDIDFKKYYQENV